MKKLLGLSIVSFFLSSSSQAQFTRYIIRLKDKQFNNFTVSNPSQFLSARALERRTRYNIPIDSTDLPVTARYLDSIRLSGAVTILNTSKWLNQVAIRTSDAVALAKINNFPFVISSAPIAPFAEHPVNKQLDAPSPGQSATGPIIPQDLTNHYSYGYSNGQVKIHQGEFLHNLGFRGEGMHMAMLDAGYYHYLSLPTFDSMRINNQVLGTWDFVANHSSVDEDHSHGMYCLSAIAANLPGVFVGTAPKASFYLYRTEDVFSEYPVEEQNYAAGLERADSAGANMVSASLGYFEFDNPVFNYTYNDMNGNTTISSRAADLAAKKGMLVVVAAGNEGTGAWHYLITPSDADSVLSVGAVDTLGNVANFSSYGPSSDGQVKPNVAAVGWNAVVANTTTGMPTYVNGTSLACPNMAGLTACLWQAFPEVNNMSVIDALQMSASRATTPDNRVGYGIPNMKKAFALLVKKLYTQQSSIVNCTATLNLSVKTGDNINIVVERKLPSETQYQNIETITGTGAFNANNFLVEDDLSAQAAGSIKYRIKMVIQADTSFYIDSLTLAHSGTCDLTAQPVIISPNPVVTDVNVSITRISPAKVELVLQNSAGQTLHKRSYDQSAGTRIETIPMKKYSRGIYVLTVFIDGKRTLTKQLLR